MRLQLDHLSLYFNNTSSARTPLLEKNESRLSRVHFAIPRDPLIPLTTNFINAHTWLSRRPLYICTSISRFCERPRGEKELNAVGERKEMGTLVIVWPAAEKCRSTHLARTCRHLFTHRICAWHNYFFRSSYIRAGSRTQLSKHQKILWELVQKSNDLNLKSGFVFYCTVLHHAHLQKRIFRAVWSFFTRAGFAHFNLSAVKVVFCPLSACYQQKAKWMRHNNRAPRVYVLRVMILTNFKEMSERTHEHLLGIGVNKSLC
jgi:hypothetical protein